MCTRIHRPPPFQECQLADKDIRKSIRLITSDCSDIAAMAEELLKHDWYKVLGCSLEDTKEHINKACRKMSLKYHPDKNPSKSAQEMFLLIQKAKEVLLDETSRLEYDTALKKVKKRRDYDEQRKGTMDASKKRLRDELEQRMKDAATRQGGGDSKAEKRARAQDIHSIRQENMSRMQSRSEEAAKRDEEYRQCVADAAARRGERFAASAGTEDLSVCLKVKWRKSDSSQSEDLLASVFKAYGHVESIQFGGSKGSSAVIVFNNATSVQMAVEGMDNSSVYKVSKIDSARQADVFSHKYDNSGVTSTGATDGLSDSSGLMTHMRRAVERDELLRNMPSMQGSVPPNGATKPTSVFIPPSTSIFSSRLATPFVASQLKDKENDILKKMMEKSAMMKQSKIEADTSAAALSADTN